MYVHTHYTYTHYYVHTYVRIRSLYVMHTRTYMYVLALHGTYYFLSLWVVSVLVRMVLQSQL